MSDPRRAATFPLVRLWAKPIYLVAAMAVLLVISAGAVLALHKYSEDSYTTAVESDELGLVTYHYYTSAWRAVTAFQPQPNVPEEAALAEQQASTAVLDEAEARFRAESDENEPSSARADLEALGADIATAHRLLQEGRYDEAFAAMLDSNTQYYIAADSVFLASTDYLNQARRAAVLSRLASIVVFLLTFASVGAVFRVYRVRQRQSEQAEAEQEILRRSEARFRPLIQSASDVICVIDAEGVFKYVSPSISTFSTAPPESFIGLSMYTFTQGEDTRRFANLLAEVSERPGITRSTEMRVYSRSDPERAPQVEVICTNRLEDPEVNGLVLNLRDISQRKQLEDQLRYQAFHDALTGLANRLRFTDRLEYSLALGKRDGGKLLSVLYMDLDYFKNVNDDMGHTAGDELLRQVADRIRGCIRSSDTAARLGGDEFAILLEGQHTPDEARAIAEQLLFNVREPYWIADREVHVSASIGVVVADPHHASAEEVIRDADIAMYDAKENGRSRIHVFEPGMQLSLSDRIALSNDLALSIERNELEVVYQPTMHLDSQRIAGFEALVRWRHPERGMLHPSQFITLAEESGFIHDLGYFVLNEACRQAREWQMEYPEMGDFTMSVNVSARQVQRSGFVWQLRQVLEDTQFNPGSLVLEITESVLIRHPRAVIVTLQEIKELGVHLALDDFGTGYSSLSYLKRFPIDILKIDRAFIEGMNETDRDKMLVQTIIELGRTLKLDIVAEGIERREQLESLQRLDCPLGQGFLFAHPLDVGSADSMLRDQSATSSSKDGESGQDVRVA